MCGQRRGGVPSACRRTSSGGAWPTWAGLAVWARDRGLETLAGRQAAHDDIDQHLETWTRTLPPGEVETLLRAAGIPAQRMLRIQDMIDHPQGESAFRMMPEPRIGEMMTSVLPFSMSVGRQAPPRPASDSASIRTKFCANGSDKQIRALRRFARLGRYREWCRNSRNRTPTEGVDRSHIATAVGTDHSFMHSPLCRGDRRR